MARPRITFFTGKGGTGKTTVSEAYAHASASAGRITLLFSLQHRRHSQGERPEPFGHEEASPRLLVDEAFHNFLKVPLLSHAIAATAPFDSFVDIAPGIKEMAVLNRLREMALGAGHDEIVVDGLATGHGAALFEAPAKSERMLVGRLKERCREIRHILEETGRTRVVLVTTPEEVAVRETVELARRLCEAAVPPRAVVLNRILPRLFESRESQAALHRLARGDASDEAPLGLAEAACALEVLMARERGQRDQWAAVAALGLPILEAPTVFGDAKSRQLAPHLGGLL